MKSRHNFSSFLASLEKTPSQHRFQFFSASLDVMPVLLKDHDDRGLGLMLALKQLPTYEERLTIAEKLHHVVLSMPELNDVLTTLHPTQHEGYKYKQKEFWKTLPCHRQSKTIESEISESSEKSSARRKKREPSDSKLFAQQAELATTKKAKDFHSTYNLRPRIAK